jgi:hypothetical protein
MPAHMLARRQGKIRGWGICNDNAYGLAAQAAAARQLGVPVSRRVHSHVV